MTVNYSVTVITRSFGTRTHLFYVAQIMVMPNKNNQGNAKLQLKDPTSLVIQNQEYFMVVGLAGTLLARQ
jgi:hypothetical protein